jgi:hypothetical protein
MSNVNRLTVMRVNPDEVQLRMLKARRERSEVILRALRALFGGKKQATLVPVEVHGACAATGPVPY